MKKAPLAVSGTAPRSTSEILVGTTLPALIASLRPAGYSSGDGAWLSAGGDELEGEVAAELDGFTELCVPSQIWCKEILSVSWGG